jgi:hypothetical protein
VNSLVGLDTCGCCKTTHPADHRDDGPKMGLDDHCGDGRDNGLLFGLKCPRL